MAASDTFPRPKFVKRITLGAVALMLAGLTSIIPGILAINTSSNPHTEQMQVVKEAATFAYRIRLALAPVSIAFSIIGFLALYIYLSESKAGKLAFAGLLVGIFFTILFLPIMGVAMYVFPAIGDLVNRGQGEMIAVMDEVFLEPFAFIPFFGGILFNFGPILIGAAIWRSGALWKWGGLLFIATGILGIPGFLDRPIIAIFGQFVGGVGMIAVGISLYQSSRKGTGTKEES